ncbi:trypsin-like serine peptidase [Kitasatospora camelliae]|uniref:Serine protease n=1 Tax=Kitasatospora camelliae TaxID=3156397 RepID=A0AAU8K1Z5_9ACTN
MGRHGRPPRRRHRVLGPLAAGTVLAVAVVGAIVGTGTLDSHARTPGTRSAAMAAAVPQQDAVAPAAAPATPSAQPSVPPSASPSVDPTADTAGVPDTALAVGKLGTTATAPADADSAKVGALFAGPAASGYHFCSASVLHSAAGNLILTAAHCLDSGSGVTFAPGYRDGRAPYGTWQVTKVHTTDRWKASADPDEDFAILEVEAEDGRPVEQAVGANALGVEASWSARARLYGYSSEAERPIVCTEDTARQDTYQRRIDCPSFPGGTSGGPWLDTATGRVIGVIGGFQEGGDTDDTSYSSFFDHTIGALYREAAAGS